MEEHENAKIISYKIRVVVEALHINVMLIMKIIINNSQ